MTTTRSSTTPFARTARWTRTTCVRWLAPDVALATLLAWGFAVALGGA